MISYIASNRFSGRCSQHSLAEVASASRLSEGYTFLKLVNGDMHCEQTTNIVQCNTPKRNRSPLAILFDSNLARKNISV